MQWAVAVCLPESLAQLFNSHVLNHCAEIMHLFQQTAECPESGPVRCEACRAYMNPFVTWLGGGRRFQCNLCGETSDVPGEYACGLGVNGRRLDAEQRPELTRGTVEYQATSQYLVHLLALPIRPGRCKPLVNAKLL